VRQSLVQLTDLRGSLRLDSGEKTSGWDFPTVTDYAATTLGVSGRTVQRAFESLKSDGKLRHLAIFSKGAKEKQVKDYLDEHPDASNHHPATRGALGNLQI
jgi:DNA-binding transcriptional regulator YhcF (GntR family)